MALNSCISLVLVLSFCFAVCASRNPLTHPFASYSIWNLPLGSDAKYVFGQIQRPTAQGMTPDPDVIILTPNAPLTTFYYSNAGWNKNVSRCSPTGGQLFRAPVPSDFVIPDPLPQTPNNAGAFLMPDGDTIVQSQPLARCASDKPATSKYMFSNVSIRGEGITGAHGGSGLSGIGGTLRLGELVKSNKDGIRHVLKVNLQSSANTYSGGSKKMSFRWPAIKADSCAPGCYKGVVPALKMGALLALNRTFDIEKIGFETEPAKMLAWTFQNYGAYLVDSTGWSVYAIETEYSPNGDLMVEFEKEWGFPFWERSRDNPWSRDMDRIFMNLCVVDSWNYDIYQTVKDSNGKLGAGGGKALQPWLPRF